MERFTALPSKIKLFRESLKPFSNGGPEKVAPRESIEARVSSDFCISPVSRPLACGLTCAEDPVPELLAVGEITDPESDSSLIASCISKFAS
mmetsp:Transcript_150749/g.274442  ORF Transcript_150749/g.274442 Transcript_150749/m.274442 type:complete len:92 (+) Transcript_150749:695-970(+)